MGGRKMHALVGLTALAACVLMMNIGTGAQATIMRDLGGHGIISFGRWTVTQFEEN